MQEQIRKRASNNERDGSLKLVELTAEHGYEFTMEEAQTAGLFGDFPIPKVRSTVWRPSFHHSCLLWRRLDWGRNNVGLPPDETPAGIVHHKKVSRGQFRNGCPATRAS